MVDKSRLVAGSGKEPPDSSNQYFVKVYDNFHPGDSSEAYVHGSYATCAEAVAAAKKIVDADLEANFKPGQSADDLYDTYKSFGEDPSVIGPYPEPVFSAWMYARRRCNELCKAGDARADGRTAPSKQYTVKVIDNYSFPEIDDYTDGVYPTYVAAVGACKKLVDSFLVREFKPGMSASELYSQYTSFGDDPYVIGGAHFSAWEYAKRRCHELCELQLPHQKESSWEQLPLYLSF